MVAPRDVSPLFMEYKKAANEEEISPWTGSNSVF